MNRALTYTTDPLQLPLVFGIDHSTAMTYTNLARQILATDSEPAGLNGIHPRFEPQVHNQHRSVEVNPRQSWW